MLLIWIIVLIIVTSSLVICCSNYLSARKYKPSKDEIIALLESVLDGSVDEYKWDKFTCVPIKQNSLLESIRRQIVELETIQNTYKNKKGYNFNEEGLKKIQIMLEKLKN